MKLEIFDPIPYQCPVCIHVGENQPFFPPVENWTTGTELIEDGCFVQLMKYYKM